MSEQQQEPQNKSYQVNFYDDKGILVGQQEYNSSPSEVPQSNPSQDFINKHISQEERDNFFALQTSASKDGVISPGQHQAHPLSLIAGSLQGAASTAIVFIILFFTNPIGLFALVPLAFFFVLTLVFTFASYKFNTFELTDSGLRLREGIIFKSDKQIPYERIHAVNTEQAVIDRILGLAKVTLETASNTNSVAKVSYLKKSDAEVLKHELFKRKVHALQGDEGGQGASEADEIAQMAEADPTIAAALAQKADAKDSSISDTVSKLGKIDGVFAGESLDYNEPVLYEHKLTNKELLLTALSEASALGIIAGILVFGLNLFGQFSSFLDDFFDKQILELETFLENPNVLDIVISFLPHIIIALLGSIVLFWIISTVINVLMYGGFSVTRKSNYFEVQRGLLARKSKTIALNRVQAVRMKQGFIRRRIGYTQVSVVTVSQGLASETADDANENGMVNSSLIHPFIKESEVTNFLREALPEFAEIPFEEELEKLPSAALRRGILRKIYMLLLSLIPFAIYFYFSKYIPEEVSRYITPIIIAIYVLAAIGEIISAILNYKHARLGFKGEHYASVTGGLTKIYTALNRNKIQEVSYTQNPFQKRLDLASVRLTTAAGATSDALLYTRDARLEQALEIFEWVRPRYDNTDEALRELNKQNLLNTEEELKLETISEEEKEKFDEA